MEVVPGSSGGEAPAADADTASASTAIESPLPGGADPPAKRQKCTAAATAVSESSGGDAAAAAAAVETAIAPEVEPVPGAATASASSKAAAASAEGTATGLEAVAVAESNEGPVPGAATIAESSEAAAKAAEKTATAAESRAATGAKSGEAAAAAAKEPSFAPEAAAAVESDEETIPAAPITKKCRLPLRGRPLPRRTVKLSETKKMELKLRSELPTTLGYHYLVQDVQEDNKNLILHLLTPRSVKNLHKTCEEFIRISKVRGKKNNFIFLFENLWEIIKSQGESKDERWNCQRVSKHDEWCFLPPGQKWTKATLEGKEMGEDYWGATTNGRGRLALAVLKKAQEVLGEEEGKKIYISPAENNCCLITCTWIENMLKRDQHALK